MEPSAEDEWQEIEAAEAAAVLVRSMSHTTSYDDTYVDDRLPGGGDKRAGAWVGACVQHENGLPPKRAKASGGLKLRGGAATPPNLQVEASWRRMLVDTRQYELLLCYSAHVSRFIHGFKKNGVTCFQETGRLRNLCDFCATWFARQHTIAPRKTERERLRSFVVCFLLLLPHRNFFCN